MQLLDATPLLIEVFDKYGNDSCYVNEGTVTIYDGISDKDSEPITITLENGMAAYNCVPGIPNILDGSAHPFQKLFQVMAEVGEEHVTLEQWAVVRGHSARSQTFTATTPEMPYLILRDPPGDQSFSFLEKDSTVSWSTVHSFQPSFSAGVWWGLRIGAVTSLGATAGFMGNGGSWSTDFGAYAIVSGSVTAGTEHDIRTGTFHSQSFTEEFSTSDQDRVVGEKGDVYIGASYINLYALADIIKYD